MTKKDPTTRRPRRCEVVGCEREYHSRGFCNLHYRRKRRDGTLRNRPPNDPVCSVAGCEREYRAGGLCNMHSQRIERTGTTDQPRKITFEERFWAKVNKHGPIPEYRPDLGPCWMWTGGGTAKGYGAIGKNRLAHRVAFELLRGPIPDGLELDHLCRVRNCVNSEHLEPVTHRENLRRGVASRHDPDQCPQGHPLAGGNLYTCPKGHRYCRICRRAGARAYKARACEANSSNPAVEGS